MIGVTDPFACPCPQSLIVALVSSTSGGVTLTVVGPRLRPPQRVNAVAAVIAGASDAAGGARSRRPPRSTTVVAGGRSAMNGCETWPPELTVIVVSAPLAVVTAAWFPPPLAQ